MIPSYLPALPLFPAPPPQPREELAGFGRGDEVFLIELKHPGRFRKARVIAVLRGCHELVLRAEAPAAIVSLNPLVHPHLIRRAS